MSHKSKVMAKTGAVLVVSLCLLLALLVAVFRAGPTLSQTGGPGDTTVIAPGLSALTIDGTGVTASDSAVAGVSSRPLFIGKLVPGQNSATLEIPESSLTFTVDVDEDTGAFTARLPQELDPGTYTLLIDDEQVATFTVGEGDAPGEEEAAPSAAGDGDSLLLIIVIVVAVVGGVAFVTRLLYVRRRSARS